MTKRMALAVPLSQFILAPMESMIGSLTSHAASQLLTGAVEAQQVAAWRESLSWLQTAARSLASARPSATNWTIVLEYAIPRRGSRVDALLIADDRLFVLEFKSTNVDLAAKRQAEDYGIELRDFHAASHAVAIVSRPRLDPTQLLCRTHSRSLALGSSRVAICVPRSTWHTPVPGISVEPVCW